MAERGHLETRQTISNDIINPRNMLSSKCEIKPKGLKSVQQYKVRHTGSFGARGRQNSNDSLVVTVEANSPSGPKGNPNHASYNR